MTAFLSPQAITLLVLAAVVAALIWDKLRSDVVALTGAAVLLMTGVVRPNQVQSAFASPAIVALASLFVIAYAMELSGLLDASIKGLVGLCRRIGRAGLWIMIGLAGTASAFLNNTPIVVLTAPVVREAARSLRLSPKRFLMPLSYAAVLGGCCTLIGTSTNLLVNDMAVVAGQPRFGIFEITPVGIAVALSGGLYLLFFSGRLMRGERTDGEASDEAIDYGAGPGLAATQVGSPNAFAAVRPLRPLKALASLAMFVAVIALAAMNVAPIAACAFAGAVLLILLRVITADEAYSGLRADVLMLIAGMVVLGIAVDVSGVARAATEFADRRARRAEPVAGADHRLWRDVVRDRALVQRHRGGAVHAGRRIARAGPARQSETVSGRRDDRRQRRLRDTVRLSDQRPRLSNGRLQLPRLR